MLPNEIDDVTHANLDFAQVKVNFWDLAGGREYFEVRNEFYKDAQGVRHPTVRNTADLRFSRSFLNFKSGTP